MDFAQQMAKLSNEKLWEIAQSEAGDYRAEAQEAARVELRERGLEHAPPTRTAHSAIVASGHEAVSRNVVDQLAEGLRPESSIWREVLAVGCLTVAVQALYQAATGLAGRLVLQAASDSIFGGADDLEWGLWLRTLTFGVAGLLGGIWLWRSWRRILGLVLIALLGLTLYREVELLVRLSNLSTLGDWLMSPDIRGVSIAKILLAITGIVAGVWLVQGDRERQRQRLEQQVEHAFE